MRHRIAIVSVVLLAGLVFVYAQTPNQPAPAKPAAKGDDEQAIRKATSVYESAFNKGDVDGLLSVWAADAEYIDEAGTSTKGKAALAAMFKKVFQDNKGIKLSIKTGAVRLLKDDVAMQDGQSHFTMAGGETSVNSFSTVWLKKDGKWLVQIVHDLTAPEGAGDKTSGGALKDLAWLIGDWVHEDKDMKTTLTAKWAKGQKFLTLEYSVRSKGEEILALTQIIGWDPTGAKLHSWVFDSRGGFGEGAWTREGNTWTVLSSGVTSDGRTGTGKMLWTHVDNDAFVQDAVDREIDGQPLPDRKTKYQRVK